MARNKAQGVNLSVFQLAKAALVFQIAIAEFKLPEWFEKIGPPEPGEWNTFPNQRQSWIDANRQIRENPFPDWEISHIFAQYLMTVSDDSDWTLKEMAESFEFEPDASGYLQFVFDCMYQSGSLWCSDAWEEGMSELDPSWNQKEWFAIQGLDEEGEDLSFECYGKDIDSPEVKAWSERRIAKVRVEQLRDAAVFELLNGLKFANDHDLSDFDAKEIM